MYPIEMASLVLHYVLAWFIKTNQMVERKPKDWVSAYQGIEDDSIPKAIEKLLQAALIPFYHFYTVQVAIYHGNVK